MRPGERDELGRLRDRRALGFLRAGRRSRPARLGRAGALVAVALALGGCLGVNRIQVFTVTIVNDTGTAVVVRDCDSYCTSSPLVFDLEPGAGVPINRAAGMHKDFSVTTSAGGRVGCLDLYFRTPQPGARVPVSAAGPCPSTSAIPWETVGLVALAVVAVLAPILLLWLHRR